MRDFFATTLFPASFAKRKRSLWARISVGDSGTIHNPGYYSELSSSKNAKQWQLGYTKLARSRCSSKVEQWQEAEAQDIHTVCWRREQRWRLHSSSSGDIVHLPASRIFGAPRSPAAGKIQAMVTSAARDISIDTGMRCFSVHSCPLPSGCTRFCPLPQ